MNLTITQTTNVKIGKKSLSQVQALFLQMMAAIDGGDAKEMFSSIENLKNAMGEKEPVERKAVPFPVMLQELRKVVANSVNPAARIAQVKELISSLEEDAAKQNPEIETIKRVILSNIQPVPYTDDCEKIELYEVRQIVDRVLDVVLYDGKLCKLMIEMGFTPIKEDDNLFYAVRRVEYTHDIENAARLGTVIRKLFEPSFGSPLNIYTIWNAASTFMGENVDVKTLDAILIGMGYLHSTDKDNGRFYCIALKPNYQYLLQPEYVPSEDDVNIEMKDN